MRSQSVITVNGMAGGQLVVATKQGINSAHWAGECSGLPVAQPLEAQELIRGFDGDDCCVVWWIACTLRAVYRESIGAAGAVVYVWTEASRAGAVTLYAVAFRDVLVSRIPVNALALGHYTVLVIGVRDAPSIAGGIRCAVAKLTARALDALQEGFYQHKCKQSFHDNNIVASTNWLINCDGNRELLMLCPRVFLFKVINAP